MMNRPLSRRSMAQGSAAMAATAALIGSMSFPKSMKAQTPVTGEIPPKTLSGTAILAIPGEPLSFNLDATADDNLWPIACNIYNSLFSLDNNFNVIMELATGYEVSDDGLAITVTLNPLATWHDGEPVTAADVKYTLEQIVGDPTTFAASLISALESVDVVDDHTAVLNLSRPSSSIIGFLSWYGVMILPAHIYEGTDWLENPANMDPIGSGPFKFVSYEAGATVTLEANESYFGEGPYLEGAIYQIIPDPNTEVQALLSGEIDVAGVPSAQVPTVEADANYVTVPKMYPSPIYLGFNTARAPLDVLEVRQAIAMGIDRDQIVATALAGYGEPQYGYYPTVIEWASNPDSTAPAFDVEGANALLDEAGFPLDGDTRFGLQYYIFTGWQELADTATVIKEQLAAIGIEVEIVTLEFAAWEEQLRSGEFDMGSVGGFQGPDPANLAVRWGSAGSFNFWSFKNEEFDSLLIEGDSAPTPEERAPFYFQAQQIMADELPGVLLALQSYYTAWTSRLSGFWLDPNDPASTQVGMNRLTLTKLEG
jgi:peptide/nickel transport system substrate-binding protein